MNKILKSYLWNKTSEISKTSIDTEIVDWLNSSANNKSIWEVSCLKEDLPYKRSTIYRAIYRLAALEKIGFASRFTHNFSHCNETKKLPYSIKIVVWSINHKLYVPLKEDYIDPDMPEQVPLFGYDFTALSNEQLAEVIERAQWQQIHRGVRERYAILPKEAINKLTDIFCKINISDPVHYAYSDNEISFMTFTAIKTMPIDIVIDTGFGPNRYNCRSLTIFGEEILRATNSMLGGFGNET